MQQRKNEHRCYWLDSEHTQFLYWIHLPDGDTWKAQILIPDKDMPREILDEIAESYRRERLNDRYQEELLDYAFVMKRIRFEKGQSGEGEQCSSSDPYEEIADPIDSILKELMPESDAQNAEMKEKFKWVLEQLLPQQIQLLYDHFISHKTLQQIADEENARNGTCIKHQAITNRINKIYIRIEKLMPEYGPTAPRRKPPKKS